MSFYADKKREHEAAAEKALSENDYAKAWWHTAKAAEYGLILAEQSAGKVAWRYVEDAQELIDLAAEMKARALGQKKTTGRRPAMRTKLAEDEEQAPSTWQLREKPDMKLDDVAGLDDVKEVLLETVIYPFQHPEVYQRFRQEAGAGVLMYGPPGNGKTFIARAIAGELDAAFFPVDCARIKDKYVGETEKNMKRLFEEAQAQERAVLFFDEVEALLSRRGNQKVNTVTQFLALTDGIVKSDNCMLLLAATNKPWMLDEAVLSRFEKRIYIPLPDRKARIQLFKLEIEKKGFKLEGITYEELADMTKGYSGRDIRNACKEAVMMMLRRANPDIYFKITKVQTLQQLQQERFKISPIKREEVIRAIKKIKPAVTKEHIKMYEEWAQKYAS